MGNVVEYIKKLLCLRHAVSTANGYSLVDTPNLLPPNGMQKPAMSKFADCHPAKPRVAVRMPVTPELMYGIPY